MALSYLKHVFQFHPFMLTVGFHILGQLDRRWVVFLLNLLGQPKSAIDGAYCPPLYAKLPKNMVVDGILISYMTLPLPLFDIPRKTWWACLVQGQAKESACQLRGSATGSAS